MDKKVKSRKRYGCEDCGATWSRKSDIPIRCRSYAVMIRKNDKNIGGYEMVEGDIDF
jgi:transposase-like protein